MCGLRYLVPFLSWSSLPRFPQAFVPAGRAKGEGSCSGGDWVSSYWESLTHSGGPDRITQVCGESWQVLQWGHCYLWKAMEIRRIPDGWGKAGVTPIYKKPGTVRSSPSVWSGRKAVAQVFLAAFCGHMEKVIWNSQHRLTRNKSCGQPQCLPVTKWGVLWMGEEQCMSGVLTWARFLTGSLAIRLCPGWHIMVRRGSMMVKGWSTFPRRRAWGTGLYLC